MLESITGPRDLKAMSEDELEESLADELRSEIIATVARTGGHLASNLGTVELTIAPYEDATGTIPPTSFC